MHKIRVDTVLSFGLAEPKKGGLKINRKTRQSPSFNFEGRFAQGDKVKREGFENGR